MKRSHMPRGAGFKRQQYVPPPAAPLRPLASPPCYGPAVLEAVPKDVKAKPGKRTPTKLEREWMDRIVAHGCVACRLDGNEPRPAAVHHILRGGRRIGHLFTLPLCDPGHHQNGSALGLVSRHPNKTRFERRYGTELELLAKLKAQLGVFHKAEYIA